MSWLAIFIPCAILIGIGLLVWLGARERKLVEATVANIHAMPEQEAKDFALQLLQRTDLFTTKCAQSALEFRSLPKGVAELFSQYEEIVRGEFWIGRAALVQQPSVTGYIKIGEDFEFEELLVQSNDPRICSFYGDITQQAALDLESVPTVWHKLIQVSGLNPLASPNPNSPT